MKVNEENVDFIFKAGYFRDDIWIDYIVFRMCRLHTHVHEFEYFIRIYAENSLFHSQIEDEGKHGNDDTRIFVLSSLANHKKTHLCCLLCKEKMLVYDRYPLVDGTLFLSPIQYTSDCIEVSIIYSSTKLWDTTKKMLTLFHFL